MKLLALLLVPLLAGFVTCWVVYWRHRMRRRVLDVLNCIDTALAGEGHATGIEMRTSSCFIVPLQLAAPPFHHASIVLQLAPKHNPLAWLVFKLRRNAELMAFQADLEAPLRSDFEGANERWSGKTRRGLDLQRGQWEFESWSPCVITTCEEFDSELSAVMNALLASRELDVSRVRFQRQSPNFSASIPLLALSTAAYHRPSFIDILRSLASEASSSRS